VNSIRILALQVDEVSSSGREGSAQLPEEEDDISGLIRYALTDASSTVSIAKLVHPDG
jgi:hypothetical protein